MRKTVLLLASTALAIVSTSGAMLLGDERSAQAAVPGDNGKIAFVSARDGDEDIFTIAPNGSEQTNLTLNTANRMGEYSPAWSPDGNKIAFRRDQPAADIFAMHADGSGVRNLTNYPGIEDDPAWSPDGSKLAFVTDRDANRENWDSNWEIYVMNADGSNQTRLTTRPSADNDPAWSPDGTKIAFAGYHDGTYSIFTINPDSTGLTRLTNGTGNYEPAWSPDGTKIAFRSQRDGNSEIYVMNANGTEQNNLTSSPATQDGNPAWSPDGTKIAFDITYGAIYTMNADGSGRTPITSTSERAVDPDWQPLSFTYEFSGFFNPVDNPDVATNKAKAGSTIPVKFSLGSDMGLDVFEDGYPRSEQIPDPQVMVDGIEQTVAASSSGLSYDSATGQYTHAWKTDKAWAGQYRQLVVKFDDGTTVRRANFSLMK